jgi:hypothetical protein
VGSLAIFVVLAYAYAVYFRWAHWRLRRVQPTVADYSLLVKGLPHDAVASEVRLGPVNMLVACEGVQAWTPVRLRYGSAVPFCWQHIPLAGVVVSNEAALVVAIMNGASG